MCIFDKHVGCAE